MKSEDAEELVQKLTGESRSVEVKRWIDPTDPKDFAKIVRCLQALRNYNGGNLVIGLDDKTLKPDTNNSPDNIVADFNEDIIQGLVSKYSSEPFDIKLFYPSRDGHQCVVIAVFPGVEVPVAAKKEIIVGDDKLVSRNDVYYRTLSSNGTVSTAKISYQDWREIIRFCRDNHEADIGRFIKRHLTPETIEGFCSEFSFKTPSLSMDEMVYQLLDDGRKRYDEVILERSRDLPRHGTFEVGLIISGEMPPRNADIDFLYILDRNNPQLSGWPIWIDSSNSDDPENRPNVNNGGWESLIINPANAWFDGTLDFMQKKSNGHFYLLRGLQEDFATTDRLRSGRAPEPNTELDFVLSIWGTAEAIAVGKAFAHALGCDPEETQLEFGFRWFGLKNRMLTSWVHPERVLFTHPKAVQDEIICRTTVPLDSSPESISEFTYKVVSDVFALFEGFKINFSVVDDLVLKRLKKRG